MVLNNTVKARSISQESIVDRDDRQMVTNTQQTPWNQIALATLNSQVTNALCKAVLHMSLAPRIIFI